MQQNGDAMDANNHTAVTSISKARTLEEIGEFWDTHSLANYWDQTQEVEFEVTAPRKRRVTLDPDIYTRIVSQAHARGVMLETLVNLWLSEKLSQRQGTNKKSPKPKSPSASRKLQKTCVATR
jgi:hypothetical protein